MNTQRFINHVFVISLFKGIGQIMLQNNFWTGLFFLAGIFCGSYMMGIAAALAVTTGTITAILLKYSDDGINSGLYGFSAALVGVALICFFQPTVIIWIAVVTGSAPGNYYTTSIYRQKNPGFYFSIYPDHLVVFGYCSLLSCFSTTSASICQHLP